jgi:hypothetical protein
MTDKKIIQLDFESLKALVVEQGSIEISNNIFLYDNDILTEFQKPMKDNGKKIDFATADIWLVVFDNGSLQVSPITSQNQLFQFLERLDIKPNGR